MRAGALPAAAVAGASLAAAFALLARPSSGVADGGEASVRNGAITFLRDTDIYLRGWLFVVRADRTGLRRVLKSFRVTDAAWSPNGRELAIADDCELKLLTPTGRLVRRLTRQRGTPCDGAPSWSPDGKRIAFVRSAQGLLGLCCTPGGSIYVIQTNGRRLRRLTRPNEATVYDGAPDWSPDGERIVFHRADSSLPDPLNGNWGNNTRLYVMRPDGSDATPLSPVQAWLPRWSPDGTEIAFKRTTFHRPPPGATSTQSIVLVNADGSRERTVVRYDTREVCREWFGLGATWSPDGTKLALSGACPPGIQVIGVDGSDAVNVTQKSADRVLSWRPLP